MASTIKIKNSSTAGAVPTASDLVQGELAINVTDRRIFTENASGTVVELGTTPSIVDNGNATAITIDSSENVGIGTSSPSTKLHVAGGNSSVASSYGFVLASNTNTGFFPDDTVIGAKIQTDGGIRFFAGGATERARIDTSGNLLVGTTSSTLGNNNGMYYAPSSGGGGQFGVNHASGIASGSYYMAFAYNGSEIGSIKQNGTTGVLYNLTSDYRLKNNQQPLTDAKEFVMALQPKKWQWWDGSGEGVGFIAHEFMAVAKHSGNGEKDAVNAEGKPVYQSIQPSSSEVMANLVAHIQELETRLAAMESK